MLFLKYFAPRESSAEENSSSFHFVGTTAIYDGIPKTMDRGVMRRQGRGKPEAAPILKQSTPRARTPARRRFLGAFKIFAFSWHLPGTIWSRVSGQRSRRAGGRKINSNRKLPHKFIRFVQHDFSRLVERVSSLSPARCREVDV